MIKLIVNGESRVLEDVMSLEQVLLLWGFADDRVVIAVNQVFVLREVWADTLLCQGDEIEVLQAVVGG